MYLAAATEAGIDVFDACSPTYEYIKTLSFEDGATGISQFHPQENKSDCPFGGMSFSNNNRYLAVGNSCRVFIWDWAESMSIERVLQVGDPGTNDGYLCFNRGDSKLICVGNEASVWDTMSGCKLGVLQFDDIDLPGEENEVVIFSVQFTPDDSMIIGSIDFLRDVRIWSADTYEEIYSYDMGRLRDFEMVKDCWGYVGMKLAWYEISLRHNDPKYKDRILIWDFEDMAEVTLSAKKFSYSLILVEDGDHEVPKRIRFCVNDSQIAVWSASNIFRFWEIETGEMVKSLVYPLFDSYALDINSAAHVVAAVDDDCTVSVFDFDSVHKTCVIGRLPHMVHELVFSMPGVILM
jgi:WD40 repeat protein